VLPSVGAGVEVAPNDVDDGVSASPRGVLPAYFCWSFLLQRVVDDT
jgi:hypothetical protein